MLSHRAQARRQIRLKEWKPGLDTTVRPTPEYVAAADGSLAEVDFRVRTDERGYILAPASDQDAAATQEIVFFGDSFVESTYADEADRFPARVQALLRAQGFKVRCLNAGYSGATTLHLLQALLAKVGRRPATTVCLIVPSNDALSLLNQEGYWALGDKRYAPIVPVSDAPAATLRESPNVADLVAVLHCFIDACERLGLPLVLATFPHRSGDFAADPWLERRFRRASLYRRIVRRRDVTNAQVRMVATQRGRCLVDLDAALSREPGCFYDDLHMNAQGSGRVAGLLADALLQNGNTSGIVTAAPDT